MGIIIIIILKSRRQNVTLLHPSWTANFIPVEESSRLCPFSSPLRNFFTNTPKSLRNFFTRPDCGLSWDISTFSFRNRATAAFYKLSMSVSNIYRITSIWDNFIWDIWARRHPKERRWRHPIRLPCRCQFFSRFFS